MLGRIIVYDLSDYSSVERSGTAAGDLELHSREPFRLRNAGGGWRQRGRNGMRRADCIYNIFSVKKQYD